MNYLEIFISTVTLFVIGSIFGWGLELIFRRFISQKKWMNPGFLVGPYLPIYGFCTIALYGLSNLNLTFIGMNEHSIVGVVIKVLMIGISIVFIELVSGLIFIKGLRIKLWDYTNHKGNVMGIICPTFSIIWLIVGSLYYFFINKHLVTTVYWLSSSEHQIYYFFIGIVIGMIIVDFAYSINLATKINKAIKTKKYKNIKDNGDFK